MPDPLFFAAESYVGTTHLGHYSIRKRGWQISLVGYGIH